MKNHKVYAHINKINGKMYIGITKAKTSQRWRNGKGYRHNKYFNNSIKKYGWDNFDHEIIASNLTKEEAENFEIALIREFDTTNNLKGYNISLGGGLVSEETREKLSKSVKESHADVSGENNPMYGRYGADNPNSKKVICITTMKVYDSVTLAQEDTNIQATNISACCIGKQFYAGKNNQGDKLVWQYYDDYLKNGLKEKPIRKFSKKVMNIDTGETYNSIKEVKEKTGINISPVLCGRQKTAGGYHWCQLGNNGKKSTYKNS